MIIRKREKEKRQGQIKRSFAGSPISLWSRIGHQITTRRIWKESLVKIKRKRRFQTQMDDEINLEKLMSLIARKKEIWYQKDQA